MTDDYHTCELALRRIVAEQGSQEAARILADFYEQHGQPSRAQLWRDDRRVSGRSGNAADLIVSDPKRRQKVMLWLLGNSLSQAAVARAFKSSASWARSRIRGIERNICTTANAERHWPTMVATRRLQAARALLPRFEPSVFVLGEPPPENWPLTKSTRSRQEPHAGTAHR